MSLDRCRLCLSRWRTRGRLSCARAIRRRDIVAERIDRGLLTVYRGLTGSGDSLRGRTFNLCFLLHNRKRHIVITVIQARRVRHLTVHYPSLALILCPDKVLDFCIRGNVAGCQFRFPVFVGSSIAPSHNTLKLFIRPRIEIHGLDSADMRAHTPVNAGAPNANKDT